jgi:hypothetical protein
MESVDTLLKVVAAELGCEEQLPGSGDHHFNSYI